MVQNFNYICTNCLVNQGFCVKDCSDILLRNDSEAKDITESLTFIIFSAFSDGKLIKGTPK